MFLLTLIMIVDNGEIASLDSLLWTLSSLDMLISYTFNGRVLIHCSFLSRSFETIYNRWRCNFSASKTLYFILSELFPLNNYF